MSAELSYKDLEQKVEYQDMYIEQLHHVIAGLKRDRFGWAGNKKSIAFFRRTPGQGRPGRTTLQGWMLGVLFEESSNPFQAQLPFQIDETIKDIPEQETELSVAGHKRKKKKDEKTSWAT